MPNSLAELNDWSNLSRTYTDQRPYSISWSANAASNVSVSIVEDQSFTAPTGIDLVTAVSLPGNITYTINTANVGNVILSWPTLPVGISSSEPSTGVYQITGTFDAVTWAQAKAATIVFKDRTANASFTSNIAYPNTANTALSNVFTYSTAVTVTASSNEITTPAAFTFDEDTPKVIPGYPQITDAYSGNLAYSISITPNTTNAVLTMASTGSANSSFDSPTRSLTVTGTKTAVNTNLANITLTPGVDWANNFSLTYSLTNPVSNLVTQVTQAANIANVDTDFSFTSSYNFAEDVQTPLVFSIDDDDPTISQVVMAVTQTVGTPGTMLVNGNNAGTGNTAVFTAVSSATFNAGNVTFVPYADDVGNVQLTANVYKTNSVGNVTIATGQVMTLNCNATHNQYSLTTAYNYSEDGGVQLVYSITDTDIRANSYTANFVDASASTGVFLINGTSQGVGNAAIITGSKATVNAANIFYVPRPDYTGNVALTFAQSKVNTLFGNISQASNIGVSMTCTSTHNDYEFVQDGVYSRNRFESYQITDTDTRATSYTVSIQQTAGNTGSWYQAGNLVSTANTVLSISNTRANINSANINWIGAENDIGNVTFVINQSKTNSLFGNIVQASNVSLTVSGNADPFVNNMITRSYTANTVNQLFSTTTPSIGESDVGQTYTISLTSSLGRFGNTAANALTSNTFTSTGNLTSINSQFANIVFMPNYGSTGANGTFSYTQNRSNVLQITSNVTLNGSAANYAGNVYVFSSSVANYSPNVVDLAFGNVQLMVVGGGGAGSPYQANVLREGSGGGGGNISVVLSGFNITTVSNITNPITVTIGSGGTSFFDDVSFMRGYDGNTTTLTTGFATFTAGGGEGGATPKNAILNSFGGGPQSFKEFDRFGNLVSSTTRVEGTMSAASRDGAGGAGLGSDGSGTAGGLGWDSNIAGTGNTFYSSGGQGSGQDINPSSSIYGLGGSGSNSVPGRTDGGNGVVVIKFS